MGARKVLWIAVCCWLAAFSVHAQDARPAATQPTQPQRAYALVVGSNVGGAGQETLRYAERDAERVANTLVEVGGHQGRDVVRLSRPTRSAVLSALDDLHARTRADADAGRDSSVTFYYSGHARAQALNLGDETLDLADLRERIFALPATLKLVVLDACQSGVFSRAKGATPAADFSFNSVDQLRTAGVAVMASSTENEVSQESESLQASYFTHHVLVALRGAGDANHDGQVTLAETYQYAYHRTLLATAATAIGGQHVTLETDLHGHGDLALSFPARADARLALPATLAAELTISHLPSRSVVAEVHKVAGDAMNLALPTGRYSVLVRRANDLQRCDVLLSAGAPVPLSMSDATCDPVQQETAASKGSSAQRPRERWAVQLGVGLGSQVHDAYTERLEDFGWGENSAPPGRLTVAGTYALERYLVVGVQAAGLDARRHARDTQDDVQRFDWRAYGLGPFARLQAPWRLFIPYVELGVGLTLAHTSFDETVVTDPNFVPRPGSDDQPPLRHVTRTQLHAGAMVTTAAGAQWMPWDHVGFFGQIGFTYAPTLSNRFDDVHDAGGVTLLVGVRVRTLEEP